MERSGSMWTALASLAAALVLAGCATPYWTRPGVTAHELARDSEACWIAAVTPDSPAALAGPARAEPAAAARAPQIQPPPLLWRRAPQEAGFARLEEQLRYEACMRDSGYRTTRPAPSPR